MTIHWGIIAPGNIARAFATALQGLPNAELHSVLSRSKTRARTFADQFNVQNSFSDLDQFLADPLLDIVYIAAPHNAHFELSCACLKRKKAVLCEKPFAVNSAQAKEIIRLASAQKTLFIEAVWTRFLPIYRQIRRWLDEQQIGDVRWVQANFSIPRTYDSSHRLFNPDLAGGSILDLGIYPVTLCDWVFDEQPSAIKALGHLGQSAVDEQMAAVLEYSDGRLAQIGSGLQVQSQHDAWIYGREGQIKINAPFWGSEGAVLYNRDSPKNGLQVTLRHDTNGYVYEASEAQRCLEAGELETQNLPHSTSIRVLRILDELRAQLGVKYAFD